MSYSCVKMQKIIFKCTRLQKNSNYMPFLDKKKKKDTFQRYLPKH